MLQGQSGGAAARRNRKDDYHLKLLLRFGMRPTSNLLDVGANQGKFLKGIAEVAPEGHHIAYEPIPKLYARLVSRFPEIEIRQRALSDRDGEFEFVHVIDPGHQGLSGLKDGDVENQAYPPGVRTETITVTTERLDGHLPDGWLPDFIKIDVEGSERLVIRGAMETLRRARPVVAFEHGWHAEASEEIYGLIVGGAGLRIFDMDGNGPMDLSRWNDELRSRWNWIAHE